MKNKDLIKLLSKQHPESEVKLLARTYIGTTELDCVLLRSQGKKSSNDTLVLVPSMIFAIKETQTVIVKKDVKKMLSRKS